MQFLQYRFSPAHHFASQQKQDTKTLRCELRPKQHFQSPIKFFGGVILAEVQLQMEI